MRNTIIGAILALLFLAGLFALPKYFPHQTVVMNPTDVAAKIEPGFTGAKQIGPWVLVCDRAANSQAAIPFSWGATKGAPAAATADNSAGRCRTILAFRRKGNPKQIMLLITFRTLSHGQRLALIVHLPPIAKKGDPVSLVWGKQGFTMPISACNKAACAAMGALDPRGEAQLTRVKGANLLLPPGANGKRLTVGVPFAGLPQALGAMRRAEAGG